MDRRTGGGSVVTEVLGNSSQEVDILCPLCQYNLRGLTEPRCPECGGVFDWDELRDPARRIHPYLFEHHPERNVSSFRRTIVGGWRPRKFWTTLYPTQPSRVRRLLLYFVIYSLIGSLCGMLLFGLQVWENYAEYARYAARNRVRMLAYYTGGNTGIHPGVPTTSPSDFFRQLWLRTTHPQLVASEQELANIKQQFGSVQRYLDFAYPAPGSRRLMMTALRWSIRSGPVLPGTTGASIPIALVQLTLAWCWPLLVPICLMLFRATMRKAQVRFSHLLRVGIYCGDSVAWLGFMMLLPLLLGVIENWPRISAGVSGTRSAPWVQTLNDLSNFLPFLFFAWMSYRLAVAIGRYLRFRHAVATAIAVQMIFGLLAMKLLLMSQGM